MAKILIIEDDHFLSSLLKGRLEKEGFEVAQAFDGEEAMKLLEEGAPTLIILDIIMPKVSGFELLDAISKDPELSKTPVLIVSNLGQESDIEKAKQFKVLGYFIKVNSSVDDIVKTVKESIAQ
jgi:DNA-binding response OmpR family regulator